MSIPEMVDYLWLFAAPIGAVLAMIAIMFGVAIITGSCIRFGMGEEVNKLGDGDDD